MVFAQNASDSSKTDTVRIKRSFKPTGVRFGIDMIPIVRSPLKDDFDGWELSADIDFYRYYAALEYGYWARDFIADNAVYSNSGTYWRIGADVNFLKNDPDRNMFFFGVRYGRSRFDETMVAESLDPVWGAGQQVLVNSNVPAGWFELTTGLRVKVWKVLWLGYTARLKFGLSTGPTAVMLPSDVPGYGRSDKEAYWGFNYQIMFRIPVRKAPSVPALK